MSNAELPKKIPVKPPEMNNDTNRILGIGLIHNRTVHKTWIYEDGNYNRNTYIGKRRIDRSEMTEEEEKIMQSRRRRGSLRGIWQQLA